jgi:cyclophilin family peptidyl-prolyl cis-trans isomerase/protein-disulfide isomerase
MLQLKLDLPEINYLDFFLMKALNYLVMLACLLLSACEPALAPTPRPLITSAPTLAQDYCTMVSSAETIQDPTQAALKELVPPVSETDWVDGPDTAAVTIIEYADFQCPGCAGLAPIIDQLRVDFPEDLRIVLRHFPNPVHDKALLSAQAVEAAGLQGKFWEMKNALFKGQPQWSGLSAEDFEEWLTRTAVDISIDPIQLLADFTSQAQVDKAQATLEEAIRLGIPYTPFLIINGVMYQGPREYASLKDVIKLMLLEQRQVTGCPAFAIDITKQYIATILTDRGTIVIQLYPDKAPYAVNSFVFLARRGFYDEITFHRVVKGYLVQTGDPSGTGYGGPGYTFPNEVDKALKYDAAGMVGMANAGPDTNGSQFFITLTAMPDLTGSYTIFGRVIQGLDVVRMLSERDQSLGIPPTDGDNLISITIEEK